MPRKKGSKGKSIFTPWNLAETSFLEFHSWTSRLLHIARQNSIQLVTSQSQMQMTYLATRFRVNILCNSSATYLSSFRQLHVITFSVYQWKKNFSVGRSSGWWAYWRRRTYFYFLQSMSRLSAPLLLCAMLQQHTRHDIDYSTRGSILFAKLLSGSGKYFSSLMKSKRLRTERLSYQFTF